MEPDDLLCSRNAHAQKVLVGRRAVEDQSAPISDNGIMLGTFVDV